MHVWRMCWCWGRGASSVADSQPTYSTSQIKVKEEQNRNVIYQWKAVWHSYCLVWYDLLPVVGVVRLWLRLLQRPISHMSGLCLSALNCEVFACLLLPGCLCGWPARYSLKCDSQECVLLWRVRWIISLRGQGFRVDSMSWIWWGWFQFSCLSRFL